MELVGILIAVAILLLFVTPRHKKVERAFLISSLHQAAEYVERESARGVPLDEAQARARRIYGFESAADKNGTSSL
jgi:hypothetical protein